MSAGPARPPILCLVTDRRRAHAGPDFSGALRALTRQAAWAADAGIDLIQVRERDIEAAALLDLVTAIREAVRGGSTGVLVNDRVDVAIACGAEGVHLRGDSLPANAVRRLAPSPFLIGRSVHGLSEARAAAPDVDYVVAGTVYETVCKPGRRDLLGEAGLHEIARSVAVPVVAIGGITIDRVSRVARAGAAGVAAIGMFLGPEGPVPLTTIVAAIRREFETGAAAPGGR